MSWEGGSELVQVLSPFCSGFISRSSLSLAHLLVDPWGHATAGNIWKFSSLWTKLLPRCQKCSHPHWPVGRKSGASFKLHTVSLACVPWQQEPSDLQSMSCICMSHELLWLRKCSLGSSSFLPAICRDNGCWLPLIVQRLVHTISCARLPCHACSRMTAVSALAQEARNNPSSHPLHLPLKCRALSRGGSQGALVVSGLFTNKLCLCYKNFMKGKFFGFQCDAFLETG